MKDKISVVIPYFNDSVTIERALHSVNSQSYKVDEVIIIDDCSNDSDVLKKIISSNINDFNFDVVIERNEKNKNGAFSRNRGIDIAKGSVIALLDADDYWKCEHIERSVLGLGDAGFLYSNVIKEHSGKEIKVKVTDVNSLDNKYDLILESAPQTSSFILRKEQFDKERIRFDENLRRHQDYQFLIEIIRKKIKINYLNEYSACYSQSPRALRSRLNFSSMFYFWDSYKPIFSKRKLDHVIIPIFYSMLLIEEKEDVYKNIESYKTANDYSKKFPFNMYSKFDLSSGKQRAFFVFLYYLTYQRGDIFVMLTKRLLRR